MFDVSPITKQPIQLFEGRYGQYLADGETNASLPKGTGPEELTLEQAPRTVGRPSRAGPAQEEGPPHGRRSPRQKGEGAEGTAGGRTGRRGGGCSSQGRAKKPAKRKAAAKKAAAKKAKPAEYARYFTPLISKRALSCGPPTAGPATGVRRSAVRLPAAIFPRSGLSGARLPMGGQDCQLLAGPLYCERNFEKVAQLCQAFPLIARAQLPLAANVPHRGFLSQSPAPLQLWVPAAVALSALLAVVDVMVPHVTVSILYAVPLALIRGAATGTGCGG